MAKRRLSLADPEHPPAKRVKTVDRLSRLSDELLLRILSYLPVTALNLCQRLSQKFHSIAADSQLWKAAYYNRFVKPRAARLPGIRDSTSASDHLFFSSKLSKWLDEENLVKRGKETNWKRQYKLRHNWSRGKCDVSEVEVAEQPPVPPILVRLHGGVVYTADSTAGLRAWSMEKKKRRLLASIAFGGEGGAAPTSLAVDTKESRDESSRVVVGFEEGQFSIFEFLPARDGLRRRYAHAASSNGMLIAVAYCAPYVLTMTVNQLLSLYRFEGHPEAKENTEILDPPRLLYSLKSHTACAPLTLAIRSSSHSIVATIAYGVPTYLSGWSVGLQELRLTLDGKLIDSRLATSATQNHFQSLSSVRFPTSSPSSRSRTPSCVSAPTESPDVYSKPTSISYTHPYLLLSHADNTLTLFLVTSTSTSLCISAGNRLWGHTSSVSGAHVGGKGKAVSVTSRGDELRIWELEGGMASSAGRRRLTNGDLSVRVRVTTEPQRAANGQPDALSDAIIERGSGLGLALEHKPEDVSITRGWIGFDEENVIVLRERSEGSQALVVYDFT